MNDSDQDEDTDTISELLFNKIGAEVKSSLRQN